MLACPQSALSNCRAFSGVDLHALREYVVSMHDRVAPQTLAALGTIVLTVGK